MRLKFCNKLPATICQVRQPIEIMAQYAAEGIATREELDNSFSKIYAKMLKAQKNAFEKTWKDRLNSKLSEIVQIKRVNEHAPKFEANQGLEAVKQAVDDREFAAGRLGIVQAFKCGVAAG